MVEPDGLSERLSLGRTIRLALIGLTIALGLIAALGIGSLYSARQDYEDELARAYELESSASALLAAGVVEEAALRESGAGAEQAQRRARAGFDAEAQRALRLAEPDEESERLVRGRIAAQARVRRLAERPPTPAREQRLANAILGAREAGLELQGRQGERRGEARDQAADDSRTALITSGAAGVLALLGALGLVAALVGSIRKPLEQLVNATGRLAGGELEQRVEPAGPRELRDLGGAFNAMAERLGTAQHRVEEERLKLAVTIESLGDALVVTDRDGVVTAANPRAAEVVPQLAPGARADGKDSPLPTLDAGAGGRGHARAGRAHAVDHGGAPRPGRVGGDRLDDSRRIGARPAREGQVGLRGHRLARAAQPADLDQGLRRAAGALERTWPSASASSST